MPAPSVEYCPMCGEEDKNTVDDYFKEPSIMARRAIENLKFLNLGFSLSYYMTDFERKVYFFHQIRGDRFAEIADILGKSEGSIKMAWKRCKLKGDKALEESCP